MPGKRCTIELDPQPNFGFFLRRKTSLVWWHTPVIPALRIKRIGSSWQLEMYSKMLPLKKTKGKQGEKC
jgi:hypothetical protein